MADTIENLIAQMNSANQSGADITTLARGYDATQALIAPYEETSKRLQQQINQLENIYGIDAREGSDFDSRNYTNPSPAIVNQFNLLKQQLNENKAAYKPYLDAQSAIDANIFDYEQKEESGLKNYQGQEIAVLKYEAKKAGLSDSAINKLVAIEQKANDIEFNELLVSRYGDPSQYGQSEPQGVPGYQNKVSKYQVPLTPEETEDAFRQALKNPDVAKQFSGSNLTDAQKLELIKSSYEDGIKRGEPPLTKPLPVFSSSYQSYKNALTEFAPQKAEYDSLNKEANVLKAKMSDLAGRSPYYPIEDLDVSEPLGAEYQAAAGNLGVIERKMASLKFAADKYENASEYASLPANTKEILTSATNRLDKGIKTALSLGLPLEDSSYVPTGDITVYGGGIFRASLLADAYDPATKTYKATPDLAAATVNASQLNEILNGANLAQKAKDNPAGYFSGATKVSSNANGDFYQKTVPFSKKVGSHLVFFVPNSGPSAGVPQYQSTYTTFTPTSGGGLGGFLGGMIKNLFTNPFNLILTVAAPYAAPYIGAAITGTSVGTATAAQAITNAAIGGAVIGGVKAIVNDQNVLQGIITGGASAAIPGYLNKYFSNSSFISGLSNTTKDALFSAISNTAVNFVATGDIGASLKEGALAGVGSIASDVAKDVLGKWSPKKLLEEGADVIPGIGGVSLGSLSESDKNKIANAFGDVAESIAAGQDPASAIQRIVTNAGFSLVRGELGSVISSLTGSGSLNANDIKKQLGIDSSAMDAKTTAAVDAGIKAAQDALLKGQDPISAFGNSLLSSGLKYVGGEIKQMTGLDFAPKTSTSTATPGTTYYDTGVGGVIGKTTSFGDSTGGGKLTYFAPSDIITDSSTGAKYIYDNGEFVRLDSGLSRIKPTAAAIGTELFGGATSGVPGDLLVSAGGPEDLVATLNRARKLYEDAGEAVPGDLATRFWDPRWLAVDIAGEAGIDPKLLFKSDGTPTPIGDAALGVVTDSASNLVNNYNGIANMMGFKNTWLNQKAQELSAYADKTRPWEIDAETQQFYDGLKAIKDSGSAVDVAKYISQFAVDHPKFAVFNVASEILQEFPQLLAGGAVMKGAQLLKFAPQIASRLGITVDAVMEIGESMGSQYNSEFSQARQALQSKVNSGELTASQADAMARETAAKSGLIAGGVTGLISTTPAGKALTKSVLAPEMGTIQNQVKDNLSKELLARGLATGRVGALEATSEGLEGGGTSALIQILNSDKPINWNDVTANATYGALVGGTTGGSISLGSNATNILQNAGVRNVDTEAAAAQVREAARTGLGVGQATQRFSQQLVETYNYSPSTADAIASEYAREAIGVDFDANLGSTNITPQQRADLIDTVFKGATPDATGTVNPSVTNQRVLDQLNQIGFDRARSTSISNTLVPVTTTGTTIGGTTTTTGVTPTGGITTTGTGTNTGTNINTNTGTNTGMNTNTNTNTNTNANAELIAAIAEQNRILQEQAAAAAAAQAAAAAEEEAQRKVAEEAAKKAAQDAAAQKLQSARQAVAAGVSAPPVTEPTSTPLSPLLTGGNAKFTSPLDPFLKQVATNQNPASQPQGQQGMQQTRVQAPQPSNYFNYGQSQSIEDVLGLTNPTNDSMFDFGYAAGFKKGGMAAPLMAKGGMSTPLMAQGGTRYGKNAHGALDIVHAAGKPRVDYRKGDAVTGAGDGQSDDIPAMLADGEYVIDSEIVSALGNGSTKAGSQLLDKFREEIRKHKRGGPLHTIPPKSKSPLQYLEMAKKSLGKRENKK